MKADAPVTLTAVAHDEDGLPKPRRMRPVDPGRPTSLTPIAATGLRLSWFVYRGAVPVTFDPVQTKVWEDTRANSNPPWGAGRETPEPPPDHQWVVQATFSEPGTYVLRCIAHDGALGTYEDGERQVVEEQGGDAARRGATRHRVGGLGQHAGQAAALGAPSAPRSC